MRGFLHGRPSSYHTHETARQSRSPTPLFRSEDESGTQRIPLHRSADCQKVFAVLNRKTLIMPWVHVTFGRRVVVRVIPHRVRGGHPPQKSTHLSVDIRTQHKLPMVRHQLERVTRNILWILSFHQNLFECRIIFVFPEDLQSGVTKIGCMVRPTRLIGSSWSWHPDTRNTEKSAINEL